MSNAVGTAEPGREKASHPIRKADLVLDLVAFLITAGCAWVQGWKAIDIIWAAWLSGLIVGLAFILVLDVRAQMGRDVDSMEHLRNRVGVSGVILAVLAVASGPGFLRVLFLVLVGIIVASLLARFVVHLLRLDMQSIHPLVRGLWVCGGCICGVGEVTLLFCGGYVGPTILACIMGLPPVVLPEGASIAPLQMAAGVLHQLAIEYWPFVLAVGLAKFGEHRETLAARRGALPDMLVPLFVAGKQVLLFILLLPIMLAGFVHVALVVVMLYFFFPWKTVSSWWAGRRRRGKPERGPSGRCDQDRWLTGAFVRGRPRK